MLRLVDENTVLLCHLIHGYEDGDVGVNAKVEVRSALSAREHQSQARELTERRCGL
jgi:hypothetical protein